MVASCHVKDALSAMTMLFSFLEIKKKLKQAGNNWWLLKYKNEVDLIIDGGYGGIEASTIIDCSNEIPVIIREGKGKLII